MMVLLVEQIIDNGGRTIAGDKPIFWVGSSRKDLRSFPAETRRRAGFELRGVQRGQKPADFKPIPDVGQGVEEIRIRTGDAFRVFYVARFNDRVYVLHVFPKKTRKTSRRDLEIGRQRYEEMLLHKAGKDDP